MDRIERIAMMEQVFDDGTAAINALFEAMKNYQAALPGIRELEAYYESGQWMDDYEADERCELPDDLKRGVLSEDAVWDMLTDNDAVLEKMAELIADSGEDEPDEL